MAKDPAFLFYTQDFIIGTQMMTDEQVGIYIRLLCMQHQVGRLTENHMKFICKSYDNDVYSKFKRDDNGLYYNERLEEEAVKRKKFCESRGENKKGKKIISSSYDSHMENENENTVFNNNNGEKKFETEQCIQICLLDQQWREKVKPKDSELREFVDHLISTGDTLKNPKDFKSHFYNWRRKRKPEEIKPTVTKHLR